MIQKVSDWARNLTQAQRNAIYKFAASAGALFVVLGIISQDELEAIFTVGGSVVTLLSTLLAIPNSGKKVTVQEKPVESGFIGDDYTL